MESIPMPDVKETQGIAPDAICGYRARSLLKRLSENSMASVGDAHPELVYGMKPSPQQLALLGTAIMRVAPNYKFQHLKSIPMPNAKEIQVICGYRTRSLLKRSVGDAHLKVVYAQKLYDLCPQMSAQQLALLHTAIMSCEKLARVALNYDFQDFFNSEKPPLVQQQADECAKEILQCMSAVSSADVLADVVKSVIGAAYMDSNGHTAVYEVFERLLEPMRTMPTMKRKSIDQVNEMHKKKCLKVDAEDLDMNDNCGDVHGVQVEPAG